MAILRSKRFWAAIFAIALTVYVFRDFEFARVWSNIVGLDYWYLVPLFFGELVIAFVRSQRWKYIIDPGKKVGWLNIFSTFSIGMMLNLLMPVLSGQIARVLLLAKKEELKKTVAFSSVVLEVFFDAAVLVAMLFVVSLFYVFPDWIRSWEIVAGAVVLVLGIILYRMSRHHKEAARKMEHRRRWRTGSVGERLADIRDGFTIGLKMLQSSRHLAYVTGLTFLSWLLQALMVYLLIAAFDLRLGVFAAVVIMVINTVMVMIVVTPINIGTFQLACMFALSLFHVEKQTAISFSLVLHTFNYVPPLFLGWLFTIREGLSLRKLLAQREKEDAYRVGEFSPSAGPNRDLGQRGPLC